MICGQSGSRTHNACGFIATQIASVNRMDRLTAQARSFRNVDAIPCSHAEFEFNAIHRSSGLKPIEFIAFMKLCGFYCELNFKRLMHTNI